LEDGLLRTCYPALRDALAQHLEQAIDIIGNRI
jgi:hypothetical protein